ncbi:MAG: hypothetical protein AB8B52_00155 [Winogradskyella sp.]|uniref:hypothetical protein n=1 Tax=Winogradskyella sp. TaxID=1883156 RepID=UPI00385A732F
MKPVDFHSDLQVLKSKVDTTPLKGGGANFKTNALVEASSSKLVYKPSLGVALFCFVFFAVGLGVIFLGCSNIFGSNSSNAPEWFLIIFGLIFASAGSFMFYFFYKPRVFDKKSGYYYAAYTFNPRASNKTRKGHSVPLTSIMAIQIIGELVRSDKGAYQSFELNLVLEDGTRKNVVDHGNLKSIISDAEMISTFLDIPIWHAKS